MIGAALFYGDATITPAISVLSAVEGLTVAAPQIRARRAAADADHPGRALRRAAHRDRARVGLLRPDHRACGSWCWAVAGLVGLMRDPSVIVAINPYYAVSFLASHEFIAFVTLGAVFLAVTGAEALYADLGHFGRRPIRTAWFAPGLSRPRAQLFRPGRAGADASHRRGDNPFFLLFPEWALIPVVVLATAATVIASQAVISGAYSLTPAGDPARPAAAHAHPVHVGDDHRADLHSAHQLAALYGGRGADAALRQLRQPRRRPTASRSARRWSSMRCSPIIVLQKCWHWRLGWRTAIIGPFVLIDVSFLAANSLKIASGGWVPILLGGALVMMMLTWRTGTGILAEKARRQEVSLRDLVEPAGQQAAAPRARHRDLPHRRPRGRADRAPPQSEAQQDHPRAEHHPDDPHRAARRASRRMTARRSRSCRRASSASP